MNTTLLAFILATFAGFATMIGTIPIFFMHLQEEKILTRLGLSLPFMIDLSLKLKFYDLLDDIVLDSDRMVDILWK